MPKITVNLTHEEELELQYRIFQYQGLQINFKEFLATERDYSEEHYNRLIDTLLEKYSALQNCILTILLKNGHKEIRVENFYFTVPEGFLIVEGR